MNRLTYIDVRTLVEKFADSGRKINILHEKSVSFGKIFSQEAIFPVVSLTYASVDSYCG